MFTLWHQPHVDTNPQAITNIEAINQLSYDAYLADIADETALTDIETLTEGIHISDEDQSAHDRYLDEMAMWDEHDRTEVNAQPNTTAIQEAELYTCFYKDWNATSVDEYVDIAEKCKGVGDIGHPVVHSLPIEEIKRLIESFIGGYIPPLSAGKKACRCQIVTLIPKDEDSCDYCRN